MANQSGYKKTIFSSGGNNNNSNYNNSMFPGIGGGSAYNVGMGGMNQPYAGMGSLSITPAKSYDVIVDPWNNKYYGEESKSTYLNHFKSQIDSLQHILNKGYTETQNRSFWGGWGNVQRTPLSDEQKTNYQSQVDDLSKQYQDFDTNYVQKRDMMASWNAYSGDWNKYFEGSYKNPRIETEQKQARVTQTDQARAQAQDYANRQELLAANNGLDIRPPKTTGTGLSSARDTSVNAYLTNGGTGLGI